MKQSLQQGLCDMFSRGTVYRPSLFYSRRLARGSGTDLGGVIFGWRVCCKVLKPKAQYTVNMTRSSTSIN